MGSLYKLLYPLEFHASLLQQDESGSFALCSSSFRNACYHRFVSFCMICIQPKKQQENIFISDNYVYVGHTYILVHMGRNTHPD